MNNIKPTKLKVLEGNPGKRSLNQYEPQPKVEQPSCPAFLCYEARVEWKRIVPKLIMLGLISRIDRAALAAYCQAYGRWAKAEKALKAIEDKFKNINAGGGLCYQTPKGYWVMQPLVGVANKSLEQMHKFLIEFGMTPASRSRISVNAPGSEDPLDKLLSTSRKN